jgi:hypothetical protein
VLQVLEGTAPVINLTSAEINLVAPIAPPGGSAVVKRSCPTCFLNAGSGLYVIFVNPFGTDNWKSGSYYLQLQVTVGAVTHRALAQIEIPF